tara:strand:+ start:377 stop:1540 length:1164 start_codon:yes stop_codon:yes gene_type:complete
MGAFAAKLLNKDLTIKRFACQFNSLQVEQIFLQSKFKQDRRVAQFLCFTVALVTTLVTFFDELIIQAEFWPNIALIGRTVIVSICIIGGIGLSFVKSLKQFKYITVLFMAFLSLSMQSMAYTYERTYILHLFFDVIILITFYFSTLVSFRLSAFLGLSYSVVALLVIFFTKDINSHTSYMVILAHVAVNLTGMIMSAHQHLMRRELFVRNTQLGQLAQEMQSQAFKDALTQLPNRRAFDNSYEDYQRITKQQQQKMKQVCVILADIDYFKQVNDNHGHEVGDGILELFSTFLTQSLRTSDDVYRFGGEEFVIVLPLCSVSDAAKIIESMITKLNTEPFEVGELSLLIRASFGLTVMREEQQKSVIARADAALYEAKGSGRNQLVVKI